MRKKPKMTMGRIAVYHCLPEMVTAPLFGLDEPGLAVVASLDEVDAVTPVAVLLVEEWAAVADWVGDDVIGPLVPVAGASGSMLEVAGLSATERFPKFMTLTISTPNSSMQYFSAASATYN